MDLGLSDKVVLVTGASSGIGAGIAEVYAQEGAKVAINYRTSVDAAETLASRMKENYGVEVGLFPGDVSREETAPRLFEAVCNYFGRVDVLVNNAAGFSPKRPAWELSTDEWRHAQDANLNSQFFMSREFIRRCVEEGRAGAVVCLLSKSAFCTSSTNNTSYISAKAGACGLMRGLANEVAGLGIRVNGVVPGYVQTDRCYRDGEERTEFVRSRLATGRFATPMEIGRIVAFLSSDCASQIIGAAVDCTGGMML